MADIVISLTIPEDKVPKASEGFLYINPIPKDPETGELLYTAKQWFKEWLRINLRNVVARGLQKKNHDENPFAPDNDLVV